MPIPIILAGLAGAAIGGSIGVGVSAAIDAYRDNKRAKALAISARDRYEENRLKLDCSHEHCWEALETLGHLKIDISSSQIRRGVSLLKKTRKVKVSGRISPIDRAELQDITRDVRNIRQLTYSNTGTTPSPVAVGIAAGAVITTTTAGITKIATLSTGGAMLASLGGGSAVAGGLLLGGLLVGPAVLVSGLIASAEASENLANAKRLSAEVDEEVAKMETLVSILQGIRKVSEQCHEMIDKLSARTTQILDELEFIITKKRNFLGRVNYERLSEEERGTVHLAFTFIRALRALLKAPLLTKEREPDQRSLQKPIQDAHRLLQGE